MTGRAGEAAAAALLRRATAADVPALAALYEDCARRLGPQVYSAVQVQAWQRFARHPQAFADYVLQPCTWVLEDAAGPLGFCGIDDAGEVRSLYVRAAATRRGTGTALLAHALATARSRGLSRFAAWATPFSLPLFRRAGFRLARTVHEPFQGEMFERYRVELP
jgi:putative acetyltransferase